MANDFLSGIQVGAQIGNMRVAQQERMIELRSQAALNAIRERELAAQADLIAQHTAQLQFNNVQNAQAMQAISGLNQRFQIGSEMIDNDDEKTPAERDALKDALRQRLTGELPMTNPRAAQLVGQAQMFIAKPELAQETIASRERIAQTGAESRLGAAQIGAQSRENVATIGAQSRERIASTKAPNGYAPSVSEKDALALQRAADAVDKAYAEGDETAISRAEKFEGDLRTAMERQHPDKLAVQDVQALRTELGVILKEYWSGGRDAKLVPEIERIKGEIKARTGKAPAATAQPTATTAQPTRYKLDLKSGRLVPAE